MNEEREREEASHPRLTHGGRSMEFQRGEDRLLNWRRASKGRRRPPCFSPLTRRGNPVLRPTRAMQRGLVVLTSDRGNGRARYSDCHFPAGIRPVLLFLRRLFSPTFNYFLRSSILANPLSHPVDVRSRTVVVIARPRPSTNDPPERGLIYFQPPLLRRLLSIRN